MFERADACGAVGALSTGGSGPGAGGASSRAGLWEAGATGAPHLGQFPKPGVSSASPLEHGVLGEAYSPPSNSPEAVKAQVRRPGPSRPYGMTRRIDLSKIQLARGRRERPTMAAVKDTVRYRSQACPAPAQRRQRWTRPALKTAYIHIFASDRGDGWYGDTNQGRPYDIGSMTFNDDPVTL